MATIWITYCWEDNRERDVDFIAQALEADLTVKLDRWNLGAGRRLWQQIEGFICKPEQSDAWVLVATGNSLSSEKCREEYYYALDRALSARGSSYPLIALFLTTVDESLLPAGIRTRLYVSVIDPDWKERIVAAAQGREQSIGRPNVEPYLLAVRKARARYVIEVRPRAGVWAPFMAAIPAVEKDRVKPSVMVGPRDRPTESGVLVTPIEGLSTDKSMWLMSYGNECTPTMSYYVWCHELPSKLVFGVYGGPPQYTKELTRPT